MQRYMETVINACITFGVECAQGVTAKRNIITRRNHYIEAFGEKLTMSQWADKTGIPYATIKRRIKRGWKPECAVTKPIRKLKNRTADTVATTHIQDRYDAYNELFYKRRKPE